MKIAVVGHPVHSQTRSGQFFVSALADNGLDVRYFSLAEFGYRTEEPAARSLDFDLFVCWQNDDLAAVLASAGKNVVLVPMYDDAIQRPRDYWRQFACCRIICFCRELYEMLAKIDLDVFYFQYFPPPVQSRRSYAQPSVFFWERRPHSALCLSSIEKLIGHWPIDRFHLHTMSDDRMVEAAVQPDTAAPANLLQSPVASRRKVSTSIWFNSHAEYISVLARYNVFIAPRMNEGIGHSFLEAMALGMCVVAADQPTMNEYIYHELNGLLFNHHWLENDRYRLGPPNLEKIGLCAQHFVAEGHRRWKSDAGRLCAAVVGRGRAERLPAKAYERQIRNRSREWLMQGGTRC